MNRNEVTTEIVMIVDKSGSMDTLANDVIGGYNSFLEEQVKNEINANISTLFFDDTFSWFEKDTPVNKAAKLSSTSYRALGMTALNDAIAKANAVLEFKNPSRAVIVIVTDGKENSSKDTQPEAAERMITAWQAKEFRVVFLAANQDAFKTGAKYGVKQETISNFDFNQKGMRSAFLAGASLSANYATGGAVGMNNAQAAYTAAVDKGSI